MSLNSEGSHNMRGRDRLIKLCVKGLETRGLIDDQRYKNRLKKELKEIDAQGEHEYLLGLHDDFQFKNILFPENQHNLLVAWLLDFAPNFDIEKPPASVQGEFPDIDVDYLKDVRDYLKRTWAANTFGQERICEIGTYGTSGIKSACLDMARVYDGFEGQTSNKDALQQITNKMSDKDDEGDELEWEKALEIYPEFKSYCDSHPEVADAASQLLDRIRTGSVHAGGLIVADRRLDGFVPLEVRMVNKENPNGVICSAWTEGLNRQDLGPVGLIKFDLLVISNLMQIALACKLIKERHGIDKICALPDQWDFSDISYLNDPKSIEMANRGDLKCIFQFDSEGIRKLVKRGGVSSFDDLAAYSAIYRPGPLNLGMDDHYCKRKRGEESYSIHPIMEKSLGKTYGILCYQEQIMDILSIVGKIPDMHTEKVRKAISKKKIKEFIKYKEIFVENGQKTLGTSEEFVLNLWDQVESFSAYGFNKSMHQDTYIPTPNGLKKIRDFQKGDKVYCVNESGLTVETEVVNLHDHGSLDCYSVVFDDGYEVVCTLDHKFLTQQGQVPLREILAKDISVFCERQKGDNYAKEEERRMGGEMRRYFCDKKDDGRSSNILSKMSRIMFQDRRVEGLLRQIFSSEVFAEQTSARMSGMPQFGLGREDMDFQMSNSFPNLGNDERASQDMQGLPEYKAGEHKSKKSKDKSIGRPSHRSLNCSEKDLCSSRDSDSESRKSKKMEGGESGEIQEMYFSCTEKSQKIKDGSLAAKTTRMEDEKDSVREKSRAEVEASRYGEGQNLDRSGRFLSLFRTSDERLIRRFPSSHRPAEGRHAEQGMFEEEGHNLDKGGHVVFPQQHRANEFGVVDFIPDYAPISDTGNLVHRKVLRIMPVGRRQCYDLEVACSTHNFILPNGVVTSNSHAYAYAYISSRLLWLKAHYPLEFYTAILMCENDTDKFKDYKSDAQKHGIEVLPVHINKSKQNFSISDGNIYFGFSNIKTIGEDVANRIVANQPYRNISDFLERFGTDVTPIKALTALGVFEEKHNRVTLRKFSEWFKKQSVLRKDRKKRYEQSLDKKIQELQELLLEEVKETDPDFQKMCEFTQESESLWQTKLSSITRQITCKYKGEELLKEVYFIKQLQELSKKRSNIIEKFKEKERDDEEYDITIDQFNPLLVKLDPEEDKILNNELVLNGHISYPIAERMYYGFEWTHVLETCPEYKGQTFDLFFDDHEKNPLKFGPVQIKVIAVRKRISKKSVEFYSVDIEDANGKCMVCNVWKDDFYRFKDEFIPGNLLCITVNPPSGGFNTFTFKSYPRHELKNMPSKEADGRLVVIKAPEETKPTKDNIFYDDDNAVKFIKKPSCESKQEDIKTKEYQIISSQIKRR